MAVSTKIGVIAAIIAVTLAYSVYQKKTIDSVLVSMDTPVLKKIPNFNIPDVSGKEKYTNSNLVKNSKGLGLVHFWATWCGPCEAEFPEFLKFAKHHENKNVQFLLVAVNDELPKIKKFLKKFKKEIPKNVRIANDAKGVMLDLFGTVKVPETYVFNKNGDNLYKFIGPQEWETDYFKDRMKFYLESLN